MKSRQTSKMAAALTVGGGIAGLAWCTTPARADVVGRLHIVVKNVDDEKPMTTAQVTVHDTANEHPDINLTPGADGGILTEPLENHGFTVTVKAKGFETQTKAVTVAPDVSTDIVVELEPVEETIVVSANKNLLHPSDTTGKQTVGGSLPQSIPVGAGNPQQLNTLVATVPGFVFDSVNQLHPRGEHSSTTTDIGGVPLGNTFQGRFGPFIAPDSLQDLEVMTGAYSPEYGGETAAVLNATVKSGTITPEYDLEAGAGGFRTRQGWFSAAGQTGEAFGPPTDDDKQAHRLAYFINATDRSTDNAVESPQPGDQTAHNHGSAQSILGRFDYTASDKDKFTLTMNDAPANTGIANRTGLPSSYDPFGDGFGYGGARVGDPNSPLFGQVGPQYPFLANPGGFGSTVTPGNDPQAFITAQQAGEDIVQRDNNGFGVGEWRHEIDPNTTSLLSFGYVHSQLDISNNNPTVNLNSLPVDNSIEFNPTVDRNSSHGEANASITRISGAHTLKAGFFDDEQSGDESYNLIPGSQLALDYLAALYPQLAPAGTVTKTIDVFGNPVYTLKPGATVPTLNVSRSGAYRAAYLQDNWKVTRKLTANYGFRVDYYRMHDNLGDVGDNTMHGSPRLNLSYEVKPTVVARLSYDHLFTEPALAEPAIFGTSTIEPEISNLYEASIEKQIKTNQVAKIDYYFKRSTNQLDTSLLLPNTQLGIYTSVNFQQSMVHGLEMSYTLTPRNNIGLGGYVSNTISTARPGGLDNTGAPAPEFNDHDQRDTFSSGASYTFKSGASVGSSFYFGSGVTSSAMVDDDRISRNYVNLSASTGPKLFGGKGGLRVDAYNIFNNLAVINFDSGFSGTRFQQGRNLVFSAFSHF